MALEMEAYFICLSPVYPWIWHGSHLQIWYNTLHISSQIIDFVSIQNNIDSKYVFLCVCKNHIDV